MATPTLSSNGGYIKTPEPSSSPAKRAATVALPVILAGAGGIAAALITASMPLLEQNIFLLFLIVILTSALAGGARAGFAASVASAAGAAYAIFSPVGSVAIEAPGDRIRFGVLVAAGLLVTFLSYALRSARRRVVERERALRESEKSYRDLFDNSADALYIIDQTGRILEANHAAGQLYGMSPDAIVGLTPAELTDVDRSDFSAERHRLERAARGEPQRFEWWGRRSDGQSLPLDITLSATRYFGLPTILAVARDVTERRALEEQLRQSQKMEALGQLAGGVAHDFNNLLTTIRGHAELLSDALDHDAVLQGDVAGIEHAAEIAGRVTAQLLAFSRIDETPEAELIALNLVVEGVQKMLGRVIRKNVTIALDLDPGAGAIFMDPGQLEQVLLNLVVNARDAMPSGGTVTIATSRLPDAGDSPRGRTCLSVGDTGIGMDHETAERVFEPFFTTKGKGDGTGLGLSTVYGIVERHGGSIRIETAPGRGTTFHMTFPFHAGSGMASPEAADEPVTSAGIPGPQVAGERILLVEDEEGVRSLMRRVLTGAGHDVDAVTSAESAWERLQDAGGRFTLLITDLSLTGEGGMELARRVRERMPKLPILFASGSDEAGPGTTPLAPPVAFLPKPFTPRQLTDSVRRISAAPAP